MLAYTMESGFAIAGLSLAQVAYQPVMVSVRESCWLLWRGRSLNSLEDAASGFYRVRRNGLPSRVHVQELNALQGQACSRLERQALPSPARSRLP